MVGFVEGLQWACVIAMIGAATNDDLTWFVIATFMLGILWGIKCIVREEQQSVHSNKRQ